MRLSYGMDHSKKKGKKKKRIKTYNSIILTNVYFFLSFFLSFFFPLLLTFSPNVHGIQGVTREVRWDIWVEEKKGRQKKKGRKRKQKNPNANLKVNPRRRSSSSSINITETVSSRTSRWRKSSDNTGDAQGWMLPTRCLRSLWPNKFVYRLA